MNESRTRGRGPERVVGIAFVMNADTNSKAADAAAMIQEGWRHLRAQRPIAAWASWQRATRLESENAPALAALERLASAPFLPAIAREEQRLQSPRDSKQRAAWDQVLKARPMHDLSLVRDAFAAISGADPADAAALFNEALCGAWLGRNLEAIAAFDRAASVAAATGSATDFELAVTAAMLAEVLRQGGGAERVADDLAHTLTLPWDDPQADPIAWLAGIAEAPLRPLPRPLDPLTGHPLEAGERAFEWLDRPLPAPSDALSATDLPRVLASVVFADGEVRFSSPLPDQLERVEEELASALPRGRQDTLELDRRSTPLPFPVIDAAVWRFRLPDGLDDETRHRLLREAVEDFYEIEWVEQPRQALGGMSPQAIADFLAVDARSDQNMRASQRLARAKLEALVRYREQLASRAHVAALHAGYPFDCLRSRLGLETLAPDGPVEPLPTRKADS